jgi:hypothetical protein
MTPRQTQLYFRFWREVCLENGWRFAGGRLADGAVLDANSWVEQVIQAAQGRALRRGCTLNAEDLRHGCHIAAFGRDCSSKAIGSGAEFSRIITLFKLLTNPDDLSAIVAWSNPDEDTRRRLVYRIRTAAPLAYILDICRDRFHGKFEAPHWDALPVPCLRNLVMVLSQRTDQFRRPIPGTPEPVEIDELAGVDCPF